MPPAKAARGAMTARALGLAAPGSFGGAAAQTGGDGSGAVNEVRELHKYNEVRMQRVTG